MLDTTQNLKIEPVGHSPEEFKLIADLLTSDFNENGHVPINIDKAGAFIYNTLREGRTFIAYVDDVPAGTIGLSVRDYWYSDATYLLNVWLYVRPEFRNSSVGSSLAAVARMVAEQENMMCILEVDNMSRRGKRNKGALLAISAGFVPFGYMRRIA